MKLTIETDLYNERRYSKPYVGVVSSLDGNVVRWGTWIGTPGSVGMLEIEVEPGEIVMHGQKDNRGNNGAPRYAIVSDEGALEYMGKAAAVNKARAIEKARAAAAPEAPSHPAQMVHLALADDGFVEACFVNGSEAEAFCLAHNLLHVPFQAAVATPPAVGTRYDATKAPTLPLGSPP